MLKKILLITIIALSFSNDYTFAVEVDQEEKSSFKILIEPNIDRVFDELKTQTPKTLSKSLSNSLKLINDLFEEEAQRQNFQAFMEKLAKSAFGPDRRQTETGRSILEFIIDKSPEILRPYIEKGSFDNFKESIREEDLRLLLKLAANDPEALGIKSQFTHESLMEIFFAHVIRAYYCLRPIDDVLKNYLISDEHHLRSFVDRYKCDIPKDLEEKLSKLIKDPIFRMSSVCDDFMIAAFAPNAFAHGKFKESDKPLVMEVASSDIQSNLIKFLFRFYPEILKIKDRDGNTAFHAMAVNREQLPFLVSLLKEDPSLFDLKNDEGENPLDVSLKQDFNYMPKIKEDLKKFELYVRSQAGDKSKIIAYQHDNSNIRRIDENDAIWEKLPQSLRNFGTNQMRFIEKREGKKEGTIPVEAFVLIYTPQEMSYREAERFCLEHGGKIPESKYSKSLAIAMYEFGCYNPDAIDFLKGKNFWSTGRGELECFDVETGSVTLNQSELQSVMCIYPITP